MGMWALAPWDNDEAADWYGYFMDKTNLREIWLDGIGADPLESPDIVRAAAALFIMLGRIYIWPIENYDNDLEMTIGALAQVASCDEYQDVPEITSLITQEINELKSRRKPDNKAPLAKNEKAWWKFW